MKRFLPAFIFLVFLCISSFSLSPQEASAASVGCVGDLPKIPISVNPTTGSQTTAFTVTLLWGNMSQENREKYNDYPVLIGLWEEGASKPTSSSGSNRDEPVYNDRSSQANTPHTISNIGIDPGTQTLSVRLNVHTPNDECFYEAQARTITVTREEGSGTGIPICEGDGDDLSDKCTPCDPDLKNEEGFQCTEGSACVEEGFTGIYYCRTLDSIHKSNPPISPNCQQFGPDGKCEIVKTDIPGFEAGIRTDARGFVQDIFAILLGFSGGIALLLIILSGYRMMASRGNPEAIQNARETLTSAIVGLLFIIFSLVVLQLVGVNILHIPGFYGESSTIPPINPGQPN